MQAAGFGGGPGGRGGRGGAAPTQPAVRPAVQPDGFEPLPDPVDTGAFNPILGYSYEELAVLSRSMHHSQGTGAMRRPGAGRSDIHDHRRARPPRNDLFDGIDTTWNRLPGGAAVKAILDEAIRGYEPAHPAKVIPLLVKARPLIAAIHDPLAKDQTGRTGRGDRAVRRPVGGSAGAAGQRRRPAELSISRRPCSIVRAPR